jgi:hypothetical protein
MQVKREKVDTSPPHSSVVSDYVKERELIAFIKSKGMPYKTFVRYESQILKCSLDSFNRAYNRMKQNKDISLFDLFKC